MKYNLKLETGVLRPPYNLSRKSYVSRDFEQFLHVERMNSAVWEEKKRRSSNFVAQEHVYIRLKDTFSRIFLRRFLRSLSPKPNLARMKATKQWWSRRSSFWKKNIYASAKKPVLLPEATIGLMNGTWLAVYNFEFHMRWRFLQLHVDSVHESVKLKGKNVRFVKSKLPGEIAIATS